MTTPPKETESADPSDSEGDASGIITVETVKPVSKRADPAWVSDEWATATGPIFTAVTEREAGHEQDLVAAVVEALDGDHARIQRVIDALTDVLLKDR